MNQLLPSVGASLQRLAFVGCCLFSVIAIPSICSAVSIDWVTVGDAGNSPNPLGPNPANYHGAVDYEFRISKYEVTNAQYADFLNAKGKIAGHQGSFRYHLQMESDPYAGGIIRSGAGTALDPYVYTPLSGRDNYPVSNVSFIDSLHFINWLNNGQGDADTNDGVYKIPSGSGNPPQTGDPFVLTRNPNATVWLPNYDEWYKSALYDPDKPGGAGYWQYATASDTLPGNALPDPGNSANYQNYPGPTTAVGAYSNSPSPWGTFDQMGNVFEWIEKDPIYMTGGTYHATALGGNVASFYFDFTVPPGFSQLQDDGPHFMHGFRVAGIVPEPSSFLLGILGGLVGTLFLRKRRRLECIR